jgi:hypothetical protein
VKGLERLGVVDRIGRRLQETMTTSDINAYLKGHGIRFAWQSSCGSKWSYVKEILAEESDEVVLAIARDLDIAVPISAPARHRAFSDLLEGEGVTIAHEDFRRAASAVESDPGSAVGLACTTLESICKAILERLGVPFPSDESLTALLKEVTKHLSLSPDGHADEDIKRVLGGLANVGAGLAALRTKYSTFHGKGSRQYRLGSRHARLAVDSLAAAGEFLIATYRERAADRARTT